MILKSFGVGVICDTGLGQSRSYTLSDANGSGLPPNSYLCQSEQLLTPKCISAILNYEP